ncbi:MAG: prepilin-type N-terminal cleavage/methylation domain-containing protein [Planctomycetota bacterium]
MRRGLTLIELVIVLAILALSAGAAAIATERVLYQKRSEVTTKTLDAFRRSLLGRYGHGESAGSLVTVSETPAIDGFIADMGRFPIAAGVDPAMQLAELWVRPSGVSPFGPKVAAGDPEVVLSCGWRGPYVDLPIGSNGLRDGFGNNMILLADDGSGGPRVATDGDAILGMTSLGSDGQIGVGDGELPLAEDTTLWLGGSASMYSADLSVRVVENGGIGGLVDPSQAGSLMVRLYLPDSNGELGFQQSAMVSTPASTTFSFPDVPIGKKILRAYWVNGAASQSATSPVTEIEIRRGGETNFQLVLPPLPIP